MRAGLIGNLRIRGKLFLLIAIFLIGFAGYGGYSYLSMYTVSVNGPVYKAITLQKDLMADIHSPPEFIIEAYVNVLQLKDARASTAIDTLILKGTDLRREYENRHAYWAATLPEGDLKVIMVKESYDSAIKFFDVRDNDLIPAMRAGDWDAANKIVITALAPAFRAHRASVDKIYAAANKESLKLENASALLQKRATQLLLVVAAGIIALLILLSIVITRGISRPISKGILFAQSIASGDLAGELDVHQRDEAGKLADALTDMSKRLREMIVSVQRNADFVASSSSQITSSAQKLSEGAQNQAASLEETSASVEELAASVDQVAEHAQTQAAAVQQGSQSMAQVQQAIEEVTKNLAEIAELAGKSVENALAGAKAVSEVVEGINLIAGSSEKIAGIVTVISDIADQTNLLALNASIEAARAGEHGRGFAVVAQEVSKLSDRSSSSTKEIESLIRESVKNVTKGVETAKGSHTAMEQIRMASQKVQEMIGELSGSMSRQVGAVRQLSSALAKVTEMSENISAATEEQTANAKQVSKAVENVNEVTQTAATSAGEMSLATEQLSQMALELQKMTAQFKIGTENGEKEALALSNNVA
jgi:methyl-accepting chemotaxis protein